MPLLRNAPGVSTGIHCVRVENHLNDGQGGVLGTTGSPAVRTNSAVVLLELLQRLLFPTVLPNLSSAL
jgi:hypothetical protein